MVELSDKIIDKMGIVFDDQDKISKLIDNDIETITNLREEVKKEYEQLSEKLIQCTTLEDFLELKNKELDRRFKQDLFNCLIYNMKVEELENKYCNKEKGLK